MTMRESGATDIEHTFTASCLLAEESLRMSPYTLH